MERRTIGSVELIALVDVVAAYPASAVYPEAGDALQRFQGYCDAHGGIALNFACFLVRDGATTVLVDTGYGPENGGRLMDELAAAGIAPGAIDIVTFTHLHEDHTAWNFEPATGQPRFPNARFLVPRGDWDYYRAATPPSASFVRDIAPLEGLGRLALLDGEQALSPSLTAVATPGHTPGHTSFAIQSGGEHGFVLGDVVLSQIDAEAPDLVTSFDWDRLMAMETRRKVIAGLVASNALVGASHIAAPGIGRFEGRDGGTRWVAC